MRFAIAIHPKVLMTWAVVGLVGHVVKSRLEKKPVEASNEEITTEYVPREAA
jgi:hypothetical protein